jgi:carboxylesterase
VEFLTTALSVAVSLGIAALVWWPVRVAIAQRVERRFDAANPRDQEGYIIGAEPLLLRGTAPGAILVLHGYNDSPQAMASVAGALHDAGWTVRVPALPGHGRRLEEFARARAGDWEDAARRELAGLLSQHTSVAVCGMSMGGALALMLAAESPAVRAVVALAPYLHVSLGMRLLHALGPVASLGSRWVAGGGRGSIKDPEAAGRIIAYRMSTPRLLRELIRVARHARAVLGNVHQPVLVIQSREDNRIPQAAAADAFARIGSADKTLRWTSGAAHVLSVDFGHEQLERDIIGWLRTKLA